MYHSNWRSRDEDYIISDLEILLKNINEQTSLFICEFVNNLNDRYLFSYYRQSGEGRTQKQLASFMYLLKKSAWIKDINGVLALGCVIKGETAHFEYISSSVSNAISKISYHEKTKIPIIFGILTTYTYDEALSRSHPLKKNKGAEVMNALLQTMCIYYKIQK